MAYEKFKPPRGGRGKMFFGPYVTVNKGGMSFNYYVKEMIGDKFKFVVFYFNREANKIGFWFWKNSCPGSYALIWNKNSDVFFVNGKSFFKAYDIAEKVEKCYTRHFLLEPEPDKEDKKNDFYCIQLKPTSVG